MLWQNYGYWCRDSPWIQVFSGPLALPTHPLITSQFSLLSMPLHGWSKPSLFLLSIDLLMPRKLSNFLALHHPPPKKRPSVVIADIHWGFVNLRYCTNCLKSVISYKPYNSTRIYHFYPQIQPYIPRINSAWSWRVILLIYSWIWFANILLTICASMFVRDTANSKLMEKL